MIKAVMFDFGGVLSRFGTAGESSTRYAHVLGCNIGDIGPKIGDLIGRWMTGRIGTEDFWMQAAARVGSPEADYVARWKATEPHNYDELYYDCARRLRQKGLVTGVMSNVNPISLEMIRQAGGYRDLAPVIVSPDVGCMKPEPGMYRLMLDKLGLPGDEVVLVDDLMANLVAAEAFEIRTVQAHEPVLTIRRLMAEVAS